jgi:hypothetical protein
VFKEETMNKTVLIILLLTSVTFCLAATSDTVRTEADIRGKITKIRRASGEEEHRMVGTVFVEAEQTAKVDKANLIITEKTRIIKKQDDKRVDGTFEDLKIGQLVEAQFVEGPTIMIYPLQVAVSEIVILKAGEQ